MEGVCGTTRDRVVAISEKKCVIEVWHIHCDAEVYKEREIELPKEVQNRLVNGRRQCCDIYKHQTARQQWGRFSIRRYQATRVVPWASSLGLMMLIPGTLLAAGSWNRQIVEVPVSIMLLEFGLITLGGMMLIASGWRVLQPLSHAIQKGEPLESLGVSSRALGFTTEVSALKSIPTGYRTGRFKGLIEIEAPLGDWEVLDEYAIDAGWYRAEDEPPCPPKAKAASQKA